MAKVTDETFAARLLRSAEQAAAIKEGKAPPARVSRRKVTAREASVAAPPSYDGARVLRVRKRVGVSQPVFASMLGVKPVTVKAWE